MPKGRAGNNCESDTGEEVILVREIQKSKAYSPPYSCSMGGFPHQMLTTICQTVFITVVEKNPQIVVKLRQKVAKSCAFLLLLGGASG